MNRGLLFLLILAIFCQITIVRADEDMEWRMRKYTGNRPGPRAYFASAYAYNPFSDEVLSSIEYLYLNGGEGPENSLKDEDGSIWKMKLHQNELNWIRMVPTNWPGYDYPRGRKHHSGSIFYHAKIDEYHLPVSVGTSSGRTNFVTYGGINSEEETLDEMWVFSEYMDKIYNAEKGSYKRCLRGVWVHVTQNYDPESELREIPESRSDAVLICLPIEAPAPPANEDEFESYAIVFLYGGQNEEGPVENAYIGMIKRVDKINPDAPIGYDIEINCLWNRKIMLSSGQGIVGATGMLDMLYDADGARVILFGGKDSFGEATNTILTYNFDTEAWSILSPITDPPSERYDQAGYIDVREHKLVIQGGLHPASGLEQITGDAFAFDLSTGNTGWSQIEEIDLPRYGHAGAYYWGSFFCGYTEGSSIELMDDFWELRPGTIGKEWHISKSSQNGLDHPSKVLKTVRIRGGDSVYIEAESANDWFLGKYTLPESIGYIIIEGVPYNGNKPGLYNYYSHVKLEDIEIPLFEVTGQKTLEDLTQVLADEKTESVVRCKTSCLISNLRIGYAECPEGSGPGECDDNFPGEGIPEEKLDELNSISIVDPQDPEDQREIMEIILIGDKGIAVGTAIHVENCEFVDNVIGLSLTCVASEPQTSVTHIKGNEFHDNYMGIWCLETTHKIQKNVFSHNHMAGIVSEKGCRSRIHDNLFIGNGYEEDLYEGWKAGILSSFIIVYGVPYIQNPIIYNNVFLEERAVSIDISYDWYQYINMPVVMNNIIQYYGSEITLSTPFWKTPDREDCQISARNNCIYPWPEEDYSNDPYLILQSADSMDAEPLVDENGYLEIESDCIDAGSYTLSPGVDSDGGYYDYHMLDIGYHFTDCLSTIGSVLHLGAVDEDEIAWDEPAFGDAIWYLIIWMDDYGWLYGSGTASTTSYEIDDELIGIGLWFGVSACDEYGRFSTPEFIQM